MQQFTCNLTILPLLIQDCLYIFMIAVLYPIQPWYSNMDWNNSSKVNRAYSCRHQAYKKKKKDIVMVRCNEQRGPKYYEIG